MRSTGGAYPYGGAGMYGGGYQPAVEVDCQRATVYTTLLDVQTAKPVPTFIVPTFNPATVRQDAPAYINQVVDVLRSSTLLRP